MEDMSPGKLAWTILKWAVPSLAVLWVIGFGLAMANVIQYRFVAPWYQEAERQVFEETRSFVRGTIDELRQMQRECLEADSEASGQALENMIVSRWDRFSSKDEAPDDLRRWIENLKEGDAQCGSS